MAPTTTTQMKLTIAKPAHKAALKHAMKKDHTRKTRKQIKAEPIRPDKHVQLPEAKTRKGNPVQQCHTTKWHHTRSQ